MTWSIKKVNRVPMRCGVAYESDTLPCQRSHDQSVVKEVPVPLRVMKPPAGIVDSYIDFSAALSTVRATGPPFLPLIFAFNSKLFAPLKDWSGTAAETWQLVTFTSKVNVYVKPIFISLGTMTDTISGTTEIFK